MIHNATINSSIKLELDVVLERHLDDLVMFAYYKCTVGLQRCFRNLPGILEIGYILSSPSVYRSARYFRIAAGVSCSFAES